jgi:hypothetical protein
MTIDTPTDALVEEAEAIAHAEWMRMLECEFLGICAERPAVRSRARPVVVTVALDQRGGWQAGGNEPWPARRRPRRVWPTQRSPPDFNNCRLNTLSSWR